MILLKISIPVYKKDGWNNLSAQGRIEVSSEVDSLADGYVSLKAQIDELLRECDAQNRLAKDAEALELEIHNKASTLRNLIRDIEKATANYEDLKLFLRRLGIDPDANRLTFDKKYLLQDASIAEVEVAQDHPF